MKIAKRFILIKMKYDIIHTPIPYIKATEIASHSSHFYFNFVFILERDAS